MCSNANLVYNNMYFIKEVIPKRYLLHSHTLCANLLPNVLFLLDLSFVYRMLSYVHL